MRKPIKTRRGGIVVLALLVALVSAPGAALASGPVVERVALVFEAEGQECSEELSYDIHLETVATFIIHFGETEEDPITVRAHFNWKGEIGDSNEKTYKVHHANKIEEVYPNLAAFEAGEPESFTGTGLLFGIFDDQGRPLLKDTGRIHVGPDGFFMAGLFQSSGVLDGPFDPHLATCAAIGG